MDRDALLKMVRFDPDELRDAIAKARKEVEELNSKKTRLEEVIGIYDWLLRVGQNSSTPMGTSKKPILRTTEGEPRFAGIEKIADGAVVVLTEHGGRAHGRKILAALKGGGPQFARLTMPTLSVAMRRDPRIEKYPRAKNTWQLNQQPREVNLPE